MHHSTSNLTQYPFYSPSLNAALFDGPIRIYFAQSQESEALKVYFQLQQKVSEFYMTGKKRFEEAGRTIFLLIYPSQVTFSQSCGEEISQDGTFIKSLNSDFALGIQGPIGELEFVRIQEGLFRIFNSQSALEPPIFSTI